jgi:hypothetical protein
MCLCSVFNCFSLSAFVSSISLTVYVSLCSAFQYLFVVFSLYLSLCLYVSMFCLSLSLYLFSLGRIKSSLFICLSLSFFVCVCMSLLLCHLSLYLCVYVSVFLPLSFLVSVSTSLSSLSLLCHLSPFSVCHLYLLSLSPSLSLSLFFLTHTHYDSHLYFPQTDRLLILLALFFSLNILAHLAHGVSHLVTILLNIFPLHSS